MSTDDHLDEVIDRLHRVVQLLGERQALTDRRVSQLSTLALFDLFAVVLSISLLVVVLSVQAPELRAAVATMNRHFGDIADDMFSIRRSLSNMTDDVASLSAIVAQVDGMQGHVGSMGDNVGNMTGRVQDMNATLGLMTAQVDDLSLSLTVMDAHILRMMQDMHHMSRPMRMFNQMNPFR
ncbi:hypothetical protein [Thiohalocapsa marina]|uniref:hypothetical protein n=1 Tax=Thiohalocapsa marina TaxID=424902 RepID=UPI0014780D48|nr:hypothetical protein [Thiohalocapsa marina]